jgi:6-phosphogluconolactonase (cycloisomerase 2 family)
MRKLIVVFGMMVTAVMMTAGMARAQAGNTCVYANDDVYFGNGPNTVDGYLVTATSQTYVAPLSTTGEGDGNSQMRNIVMHPTNSILYASDSHSGDIAAMKINPSTCQLTLLGVYPLPGGASQGIGLAITPDGKHMYAAGVSSAELNGLDVLADGSLTSVRQKVALANKPSAMAVSPDGSTLIIGLPETRGGREEELVSYSINSSTGVVTPVSIVNAYGFPGSIAINAQSTFAYVEEPDIDALRVSLFGIGKGGTVTFVKAYDFSEITGDYLSADALLSVTGKYLYVTNPQLASISTLQVNSVTGALKYVTTSEDGTLGSDAPLGLATSKNGEFIFTGDDLFGDYLGILAAGQDGSLTSLGTFPMDSAGLTRWIAAKSF